MKMGDEPTSFTLLEDERPSIIRWLVSQVESHDRGARGHSNVEVEGLDGEVGRPIALARESFEDIAEDLYDRFATFHASGVAGEGKEDGGVVGPGLFESIPGEIVEGVDEGRGSVPDLFLRVALHGLPQERSGEEGEIHQNPDTTSDHRPLLPFRPASGLDSTPLRGGATR